MFDWPTDSKPIFVLVGIIVAQLFMYGRKVKDRVHIALSDVIADLMQFGVMFVVCMGFLALAKTITGWNLNDPWQLVTVVIMFNMSFDAWFNRLRETFNNKVGAAFDVLLGRKIAVDGNINVAPARRAPSEHVAKPIVEVYKKPVDGYDPDIEHLVHELDNEPFERDNDAP
jgi:hypothetical protein